MTNSDDLIKYLSTQRLNPHSDGMMDSMGMPWRELPTWDDLELVTTSTTTDQASSVADDGEIDTQLVLGAHRAKPLALAIPLIVADMSFGALSMLAKVALAKGAES